MRGENRIKRGNRFRRTMRLLRRFHTLPLPVTSRGNRAEFYHHASVFFQSLHAALHCAKRFILVEYYLIRDDSTGAAFAAELAEAARRGVTVLMIYDYIGSVDTPASFFERMAKERIDLVPFNVLSLRRGLHWFDRRDHRKMVVIDGMVAFLGGFNIGDEYAGLVQGPRRFRDMGLSISGSSVKELVSLFSETWLMERGDLPRLPPVDGDHAGDPQGIGEATVTIVSGGPHHRRSRIRGAYLVNIASASEEILIATPYFVPGPRMMRSLLRAARRGVRVRLLLPARSDVPLVRLLGRSYYAALLKNGVEISELGREILHTKVMVIDSERTIIGSANIDQRSFHRNFEINLVIEDGAFSGQIKEALLQDFADSRRIILDDHEQRGIATRFFERLIALFGWFL